MATTDPSLPALVVQESLAFVQVGGCCRLMVDNTGCGREDNGIDVTSSVSAAAYINISRAWRVVAVAVAVATTVIAGRQLPCSGVLAITFLARGGFNSMPPRLRPRPSSALPVVAGPALLPEFSCSWRASQSSDPLLLAWCAARTTQWR